MKQLYVDLLLRNIHTVPADNVVSLLLFVRSVACKVGICLALIKITYLVTITEINAAR